MDTRNENCELPYVRCYYPHRLIDALSHVCGFFFNVIPQSMFINALPLKSFKGSHTSVVREDKT